MSLIGSRWSSTLFGNLSAMGFVGTHLQKFTDAVGLGSVAHVAGKPFATADVGSVAGAGVGTGVGIVGIVEADLSNLIFTKCVSRFGQAGSHLKICCDALAASCKTEMALATLTSSHAPVFLGAGTVVVGSVGVVPLGWGADIAAAGTLQSFIGVQWPNFSAAIGEGQAEHVIANGTGTVAIVGSGGIPSGGAGAGAGVIS